MEPVSIASNIVNGDNVRLKVKYVNGDLSLYYSLESSGEYVLIKTYLYDEIKDLFIHDLDKSVSFGLVAEAYMGSASVGMDNVINYSSNASINS